MLKYLYLWLLWNADVFHWKISFYYVLRQLHIIKKIYNIWNSLLDIVVVTILKTESYLRRLLCGVKGYPMTYTLFASFSMIRIKKPTMQIHTNTHFDLIIQSCKPCPTQTNSSCEWSLWHTHQRVYASGL